MNAHLAALLVREVEDNSGAAGLRKLVAGQGALRFPAGVDIDAMTAKVRELAAIRLADLGAY